MGRRAPSGVERDAAAAGRDRDRALRDTVVGEGADRWRARGVVHTPPEVARWIAQAADRALQDLGLSGGLSDPEVAIVDPACGPGAFLAAALATAGDRRTRPRQVVGVDVDRDALASARRVLAGPFAAAAWPLSLVEGDTLASLQPFDPAEPSAAVAVLGNPPWAGRSANRGAEATAALLEDFRCDGAGRRLDERKLGVLSDDYVRFFRWACEVVRRAGGGGVVAFVTNASFVDGAVHRGMREALLRWFDGVDVLELGGSALVARAGGRDENVFGVRPAAAATIAWRAAASGQGPAALRHGELRGPKRDKLAALAANAATLVPLRGEAPAFLFRPAGAPIHPAYHRWPSLAEAMPFNREGIQTNRDAVAVDTDRERLLDRARAFAAGRGGASLALAERSSRHYNPERARRAVAAALARDPDGLLGISARRVAYRPFDERWFVPVAPFCHRPRPALLSAVDRGGPVLITVRKDRGRRPWTHFGAAQDVPDNCWLSTRSSCRARAFPPRAPDGTANLAPAFASACSARIGVPCEPEAVIRYALALLAAPSYRRAFDGALHVDYPRLPFPPDGEAWRALVDAGEGIVQAFTVSGTGGAPADDSVTIGHGEHTAPELADAIVRAEAVVGPLLSAILGG